MFPRERFSPCNSYFSHSEAGGNPYDPCDLLIGQDIPVLDAVDTLRRHAIDTPEVAPVGNRDAQVIYGAVEFICEFCIFHKG